VTRTLEEWQAIHERIKIHRRSSLLQAESGALLDQLLQDPRINASFGARPDKTIVFVAPRQGEADELVRNLQMVGYPPARTRSASQPLRPAFTIDETGRLHFTTALPSIYLYEQITPVTGRDERGHYYVTQSAVQQAIAGGLSVDDILGRLRKLHLGPLPRWIEIKIRAWGHYYGDVAVQTVTLVQFKDAKTLQEILSEPELTGVLKAFCPDEDKALAVVTGDAAALQQAFAERNIKAEEQLE
jgi:hypothetical protein